MKRETTVLLISDDAALVGDVSQARPPDTVLCAIPRQTDQPPPTRVRQCWVDLDGHGNPALPLAERYVYFHGEDFNLDQKLPAGIFLHKPCSERLLRTLWQQVDAADDDLDADGLADVSLPGWILEYQQLSLPELTRRLVHLLPRRLGYAHASLYLRSGDSGAITLADCNHAHPVAPQLPDDSLMAEVAASREIFLTQEISEKLAQRGGAPTGRPYNDESCLICPLVANDELVGVLNFCERLSHPPLPSRDTLRGIVRFISATLSQTLELEHALTEASVDGLTGLYNHRWMVDTLEREIRRAQRFQTPLSVIVIDLDGLKGVNDHFGHNAGDHLLRHVGQTIRAGLRRFDSAARTGGDEFVVALPATDTNGAEQVARRILTDLRSEQTVFEDTPLQTSASMGIAEWQPEWNAARLIAAADHAMYHAKRHGRDQLVTDAPRSSLRELVACNIAPPDRGSQQPTIRP